MTVSTATFLEDHPDCETFTYERYRRYFNLPRGTWSIARDLGVPKSFSRSWVDSADPDLPYAIRCAWARRNEDGDPSEVEGYVTQRDQEICESMDSLKEQALGRVTCSVGEGTRRKRNADRTVELHLGPTNSGKTRDTIEGLVAAYRADPSGTYIYAGPLRALAHEVRDKIASRVGEDAVGILTGEVSDNPDAAIICSTVEMAPYSGDVLVVDEAHWCTDPTRGERWVSLLTKADYQKMFVIGPVECENIFCQMLDDYASDSISIHHHFRMTELTLARDEVALSAVPSRTAVVVFSRRKVKEVAGILAHATGKNVVMLYGAMPASVRSRQIAKFDSGDADIIVTTDVIGHGINLPIDNVLVWESSKFDGTVCRDLYLWELAQIVGRAGRYGLSREGRVYCGPYAERSLLARAVDVAAGRAPSELSSMCARAVTCLEDLGLTDSTQSFAVDVLATWKSLCAEATSHIGWIEPADVSRLCVQYTRASRILGMPMGTASMEEVAQRRALYENPNGSARHGNSWPVGAEELWNFFCVPIEPSSQAFFHGVTYLAGRSDLGTLASYYESVTNRALTASERPPRHSREVDEQMSELEDMMVEIRSAVGLSFALRNTPGGAVASSYLTTCSLVEESVSDMLNLCLDMIESASSAMTFDEDGGRQVLHSGRRGGERRNLRYRNQPVSVR